MYQSFRTRADQLLIQAQCAIDRRTIRMRMIALAIIGLCKPLLVHERLNVTRHDIVQIINKTINLVKVAC